MVHRVPTGRVGFSFLDAHALFLLVLCALAIFLFARWVESADRSAYGVGALAAITLPFWTIVTFVQTWLDGGYTFWPDFGAGALDGIIDSVFLVVRWGLFGAFVFFAVRPLWLTGVFLMAPQGVVRRRWKDLESSWQFAAGALIAGQIAAYLAVLTLRYY